MIEYLLELMVKRFQELKLRERKIGVYYASELPMCLRRLYYIYKLGVKTPLDSFLLMESGRMMHSWLNEVFETVKELRIGDKTYYIDVEKEGEVVYTVNDEIEIRGRFDDIIKLSVGDTYYDTYLVEIKSISDISKAFPRDRHVMQLNFYMHLMNMDKGYLLYISRMDYKYRVYEIKYNRELFDMLVERAKQLHYFLKKGIEPEREGFYTGMCNYCEFRRRCLNVHK